MQYLCTGCGRSIWLNTDGELNISLGCPECASKTHHQHVGTALDRAGATEDEHD